MQNNNSFFSTGHTITKSQMARMLAIRGQLHPSSIKSPLNKVQRLELSSAVFKPFLADDMEISDEETTPQFDHQMEELRRQALKNELIRKTVELITCDLIKSVENDVKRVSYGNSSTL